MDAEYRCLFEQVWLYSIVCEDLCFILWYLFILQREEKQLDASVEALIQQASDIKNSIGAFLWKLENEYEQINWWVVA